MQKKNREDTVLDLLFRAAKSNPSKTYCKSVSHNLTYQQFMSAVIKLSREISQKQLKNEYIAVLLPNSILFLITYFAVLVSGNKPALLNFLLPESALGKLLDDLQPSLVLSNKKLSKYKHLMLEIEDYIDIEQLDIKEVSHSCIGDDVGVVLFSGGTTGIPKQINHSHKSISFMVDRMEVGMAN